MSIAASEANHEIWRAVVGPSVKIPAVNSYAYYFPQGHLENSSGVDYNYDGVQTSIPCRVLSLCFLSTSSSDESFVKIILHPVHAAEIRANENHDEDDDNQNDIASFPKILSSSDANNDRGFSVPKYCTDTIFPKLNLLDDHPVQKLSIRDAHNNAWEFRHIFTGTPPRVRHLLTTGWSKFVNSKGLVAGDSVVFMKRKSTREMFIGIRRNALLDGDENSRIQAALEAIEKAKNGRVFEVDYYPRFGFPEFVVSAARVEMSMRTQWRRGMRVKMPVRTDDPGRFTWYGGRIKLAKSLISEQWPQYPWRMLQVYWDELQVPPNMNKVNPWEVKCQSAFPPTKKPKLSQNPDDDEDHGEFSFPNLIESNLNSTPSFHHPPFPATVECDDPNHQPPTKVPATAPNIVISSTNFQQGHNSLTGEGTRCSIMLFGKNIQNGGEGGWFQK